MNSRAIASFSKAVLDKWYQDNVSQLAAALAYYTVFSIAPLVVIFAAIGGLALGKQTVQDYILGQVQGMLGAKGAQAIQVVISGITRSSSSLIATSISTAVMLFGASRVFVQLHDALNTIWEVDRSGRRIVDTVKDRTYTFLIMLAAGFLMVLSLLINTTVATVVRYFDSYLPGGDAIWRLVDFAVPFGMLTMTFAMLFKILPSIKIAWRDVWGGAVLTTLLFSIARYLLAFYLHRGAMGSVYGAASSFFVILFWFYVSTQVLLLGAEFTQVYASRYGSHKPAEPT